MYRIVFCETFPVFAAGEIWRNTGEITMLSVFKIWQNIIHNKWYDEREKSVESVESES